jgi:hypothetical protein
MEETSFDINCVEIKVARCDPYPMIDPQGYVVGFVIYCLKNGKSMYRDVLVSFMELAKTAEQQGAIEEGRDLIMDMAYEKIKEAIATWYKNISEKPALLGSVYKPKQQ